MRILFFTFYPPSTGYDSFSSYWAVRELAEAEHEVAVICSNNETGRRGKVAITSSEECLIKGKNCEIYRIPDREFTKREKKAQDLSGRLVNVALAVLEHFDAELIMTSNFFPCGLGGFYTSMLTGIPLVMRIKYPRNLHRSLAMEIVQAALKRAERIEISDHDREHFLRQGVPQSKLMFHDGLVDDTMFSAARKEFDFTPYTDMKVKERFLITVLDDGDPLAKLKFLCEALAPVNERDLAICLQLSTDNPAVLEQVQDLVEEADMTSKIFIIPPQPPWRFASLMDATGCLMFPGSSGRARDDRQFIPVPFMMEALYCGRCVLLSGGAHARSRFSHLRDGEEVLLFDSVKECREKLEQVCRAPEIAVTTGERARKKILSGRDSRKSFENRCAIYQEIASRPGR